MSINEISVASSFAWCISVKSFGNFNYHTYSKNPLAKYEATN